MRRLSGRSQGEGGRPSAARVMIKQANLLRRNHPEGDNRLDVWQLALKRRGPCLRSDRRQIVAPLCFALSFLANCRAKKSILQTAFCAWFQC